jgi:hypothetical protein
MPPRRKGLVLSCKKLFDKTPWNLTEESSLSLSMGLSLQFGGKTDLSFEPLELNSYMVTLSFRDTSVTRAKASNRVRRDAGKTEIAILSNVYYFHPDPNTSNPEVQTEILKVMGFWLQLGRSLVSAWMRSPLSSPKRRRSQARYRSAA